jgi:dimethylargininase
MLTALTRAVGPSIVHCELEFLARLEIDFAEAVREHCNYVTNLEALGLHVITLQADPQFPDGLFVEDPAIVLDEIAVICRMSAISRCGESPSISTALEPFRELIPITEPATIEGGDVMRLGKTLYCGISRRTNREGFTQLGDLTRNFGYRVIPVEVHGCLHLKSAVCPIAENTVLANRRLVDMLPLSDLIVYDVADDEPDAANVLWIGQKIILPDCFPKTREQLERAGFQTIAIKMQELRKAESGVTCSSLIFET